MLGVWRRARSLLPGKGKPGRVKHSSQRAFCGAHWVLAECLNGSCCSFLGNGAFRPGKMASRLNELRHLSPAHRLRETRNITSLPHAPPPLPGLTGLPFSNSVAVRRAAQRYGLREGGETNDWTLYWTDYSVSLERVMEMKSYQVLSGAEPVLSISLVSTQWAPNFRTVP